MSYLVARVRWNSDVVEMLCVMLSAAVDPSRRGRMGGGGVVDRFMSAVERRRPFCFSMGVFLLANCRACCRRFGLRATSCSCLNWADN